MRTILLASAAVLALSQVTYAQGPSKSSPPTANQPTNSTDQAASNQRMGPKLRAMLEKSGYTDIRVAATSFMVHAKDSDGNPVVMALSPDSFTEVSDMTTTGGATHGSTTGAATTGNPSGSDRFVTISGNDDLGSKIMGLDVYNDNKQDIGQIKDIALNDSGQTQAYVLSVGGFLGMGEHYVAVNPASMKVSYNDSEKKWHASMNATSDQLKSAPEFKYTGRWSASKM